MEPLFSVQDQIVLVSGGTRGIGYAIAAGFAERGAKVIVTGRTAGAAEGAAQQMSGKAALPPLGLACDVSRPEQVKQLVQRVLGEFDRVDTLINCAGVNRRKPALAVSEDDYDYILDTNLRGAFLLSCEVGRAMVER